MGNKKICSCGHWNHEQEECLYSGHGCVYDEQIKSLLTPIPEEKKKELIRKWAKVFMTLCETGASKKMYERYMDATLQAHDALKEGKEE